MADILIYLAVASVVAWFSYHLGYSVGFYEGMTKCLDTIKVQFERVNKSKGE